MNIEIRSERSNEEVLSKRKIKKLIDKETYANFLKGENHNHDHFGLGKITPKQAKTVLEKVAALPSEELAVIFLMFWEEQSIDEISSTLCLSTDDVNQLLQSALLRLKNNLLELEPAKCA
jgi:DNA-directed RNA polymerase specialized sigma24 family protein